jgi:glucose/arabinose dehydrogenase/uncharacterized cupredoxin-like copper-binding protein
MTRIRLTAILIFAVLLGGMSLATTSAQEATPAAGAALGPVATPGGTLPNNPQVQLVKVAGGLADPVNLTSAYDGSGRLFVVERVGRLRIIDQSGKLLPDPFLDLSDVVKTDFLEQGLLGVAFHPDFKNTGLFYVYYNDYLTGGDVFLVEYHVSKDDPNKADPESGRVLLTQDKPFINHNGGTIHFGPDGYLYVAMGDGGLAGDPYDNAQKVNTLLGKILRIDVNSRDAGAYGIPKDNPFANTGEVILSDQASQMAQDGAYHPEARREICDWGLRNPWQFAFDPKGGDLYIADVGQNAWEEVNSLPAAQPCGWNLGWDPNEGAHCYPPTATSCDKNGMLPVANYSHDSGDCSITGMGVYRAQTSPSLDGIYFNSDFCSGTIYGLARGQDNAWTYQPLLKTSLKATGAGQDEAGEVYLTVCACEYSRTYNADANPGGTVWRVVSADKVPQGAETAPAPTPEEAATAEATPSASQATPAAAGATGQGETSVAMVDIAFQPKEITIPANTDVTVSLPNQGASVHNFNVDKLNVHSGNVQPGQTGSVTINAPAGDYEYDCDVPGHKEAGMVGTIHVT